jgi:hypothetical protein
VIQRWSRGRPFNGHRQAGTRVSVLGRYGSYPKFGGGYASPCGGSRPGYHVDWQVEGVMERPEMQPPCTQSCTWIGVASSRSNRGPATGCDRELASARHPRFPSSSLPSSLMVSPTASSLCLSSRCLRASRHNAHMKPSLSHLNWLRDSLGHSRGCDAAPGDESVALLLWTCR